MSAPNHPDWFRIVKDFGFRNGPTIPFILGATRVRPLNTAPRDRAIGQELLYGLLNEMCSTRLADAYGVAIEYCPTIRTWVVAKRRPAIAPLEWDPAMNIANVDALFGRLWKGYGNIISTGAYSLNPTTGEWGAFSPAEVGRILEVLDE